MGNPNIVIIVYAKEALIRGQRRINDQFSDLTSSNEKMKGTDMSHLPHPHASL